MTIVIALAIFFDVLLVGVFLVLLFSSENSTLVDRLTQLGGGGAGAQAVVRATSNPPPGHREHCSMQHGHCRVALLEGQASAGDPDLGRKPRPKRLSVRECGLLNAKRVQEG